jgi:hypothetical protein
MGSVMGGKNPISDNASMFNPIDAAAMSSGGQMNIDPNKTTALEAVRMMLRQMKIDENGPASQLVEFGRKQVENATMEGKMKNIAASGGAPGGAPAPRPAAPAPTQGLEGLLNAGRQ